MSLYQAASLHGPLARALAGGTPGLVVSAHRRALNVALGGGEMLSLVAPELGNGPAAMVVPGDWPLPWPVGAEVSATLGWLTGPGAAVVWVGAPLWTPPATPSLASPDRLRAAVQEAAAALAMAGAGCGLTAGVAAALAAGPLAALLAGRWGEAVRGLAGLGPGLTPAGDDLLGGFVVALRRGGADPGPLAAALLDLPPGATVPLSQSLLRWAARGVAGEHHLRWLDGLLAGRPVPPDLLLTHGATSGADWAAGALLALHHRIAKEMTVCR